jgi:AcrR family transcriptional regulator
VTVPGSGQGTMQRAPNEDTRSRLLDAAAAVLARDGIDASLEAIAFEAGVTRMTLYRQVGTRGQLLVAVLLRAGGRIADELVPVLDDRSRPIADRLVDAIAQVIASVRESPVLAVFVEGITPTQAEGLDTVDRFLDAVWDFLLPYFDDPGVRPSLRAEPERVLDWTLRQTLLQLTVHSRFGSDDGALRLDLRTFFIPSILHT